MSFGLQDHIPAAGSVREPVASILDDKLEGKDSIRQETEGTEYEGMLC